MRPRPPASSTRAREHLAILAGALAAGACGALFDQVTGTISPEYFLDGKGLAASSLPFRLAVAWTGFRGGLPLGALVTGVGLLRAARSDRFSWRSWLVRIMAALAAALALCPAAMAALDPFGVREASLGAWPRGTATRYLVCCGIHAGVYLGVLVGVLLEGRSAPAASVDPSTDSSAKRRGHQHDGVA
ncbi:hypothetical protein WMF20_18060 [Sorangium sp. So ce834]|uniref:hypothetical protein n=1 Tax=Sorangium sp. So ce834 TaxID=3133321 RepID=UPI003F5E1452